MNVDEECMRVDETIADLMKGIRELIRARNC